MISGKLWRIIHMTRILFLHQVSFIGGGSYCLLNVIKALDKTKWEPVVALKNHGPLEEDLRNLGVEVLLFPQMTGIPYNLPLTLRNMLTYLKLLWSLKSFGEFLLVERIEVLYLNNMMIAPYLIPAKKVGCKTVMHVREHWPLDQHKKQLNWVRNLVYANCDKLIAINHYSASIFPQMEATIVYDWIDMKSRYKYMPLSEIFDEDMRDKKVYLFTGGLQPIKGVLQVLSAFVNNIQDSSARLLCIGLNPIIETRSLRGKIKKILSTIGIQSYNWKVKKMMDSDSRIKNIPATYMITHIMQQCYCNLSYFTIPHANLAMVEAEILGLPSVAALNEEAIEYSLNGECAVLYEINNYEQFLNAIAWMQKNYNHYKYVLKNKASITAEMFDKEKNCKLLNYILSTVVEL